MGSCGGTARAPPSLPPSPINPRLGPLKAKALPTLPSPGVPTTRNRNQPKFTQPSSHLHALSAHGILEGDNLVAHQQVIICTGSEWDEGRGSRGMGLHSWLQTRWPCTQQHPAVHPAERRSLPSLLSNRPVTYLSRRLRRHYR